MTLPELCIRRPVFATVMSLFLILLGLVSYSRLAVREYPNIDEPVMTVSTSYLGASAEIMETQVTKPLEDALAGIEGIDAAFVYGSVAKGGERSGSDIDLMVVGDMDSDALYRTIRNAEKMLGREVSLATMGPDEWRSRLASRDAFVADLLKTDKIFLAGDERALRRA